MAAVLQNREKVFIQLVHQFIFVHRCGIGAVMDALTVVFAADPANICILIGPTDPPERPAALFADDEGGEEIFVAVALFLEMKHIIPRLHQRAGPVKKLVTDDPQIRLFHHQPVRFLPVHTRTGEEIRHLLLAVDDLAGVEGIGEDAADGLLVPAAAPLGLEPPAVQHVRDLAGAVALLQIPGVDLTDDGSLLGVDGEAEIVSDGLVIAVNKVGDFPFFSVDALAELDALGGVAGFFLGQGTKNGKDKLTVTHGSHVRGQEHGLDAQGFQAADALQQVHRVAGQAGDVLHHEDLEHPTLSIQHHLLEFLAVLDLGAGDALVGIEPDQVMSVFLCVFHEEVFLDGKAVELVRLVRGNAAVRGDPRREITSFLVGLWDGRDYAVRSFAAAASSPVRTGRFAWVRSESSSSS